MADWLSGWGAGLVEKIVISTQDLAMAVAELDIIIFGCPLKPDDSYFIVLSKPSLYLGKIDIALFG